MDRRQDADDRIAHAVQSSVFGGLPPKLVDRILADSLFVDVPAGAVVYREGEAPRTGLVVTGLVRIYLTSVEGRQLTVRYARAGATLGAPTAIGGPAAVAAQAVTDCSLLMFSAAVLGGLASADVRVAWPLAHLHEDHIGGIAYLPDAEFVVSELEWRELAKPAPELRGFLRAHIDRAAFVSERFSSSRPMTPLSRHSPPPLT